MRKAVEIILRKYPRLGGAAIKLWNRGASNRCAYVTSGPSAQMTCDIFKGEWYSKLPVDAVTGSEELCNDLRLNWLGEEVEVRGKSVVELGPLEGAHSFMLEQMGATRVTAVEANSQAYLKCLITKELLRLQRVDFVLADFMEYLRQTDAVFDIAVACGVLYHMANPVELISLLGRRCRGHLLLWTHYFDGAVLGKDPAFKLRFTKETGATHEGFGHVLHRSKYVHADKWSGFCGGSAAYANWLSREDILDCLTHFGFEGVKVRFDDPSHPNGPAFALIAKKSDAVPVPGK